MLVPAVVVYVNGSTNEASRVPEVSPVQLNGVPKSPGPTGSPAAQAATDSAKAVDTPSEPTNSTVAISVAFRFNVLRSVFTMFFLRRTRLLCSMHHCGL